MASCRGDDVFQLHPPTTSTPTLAAATTEPTNQPSSITLSSCTPSRSLRSVEASTTVISVSMRARVLSSARSSMSCAIDRWLLTRKTVCGLPICMPHLSQPSSLYEYTSALLACCPSPPPFPLRTCAGSSILVLLTSTHPNRRWAATLSSTSSRSSSSRSTKMSAASTWHARRGRQVGAAGAAGG